VLPEATQTIDIFAFVDDGSIPWINFHKPYFLSPDPSGNPHKATLAAAISYDDALVVMLLR